MLQRPSRRGVQRHLAVLQPLAVTDVNTARPVAQADIGDPQRGHLAYPEPGLKHELDKRIVASGKAMGGSAGCPQQRMDLGVEKAKWLTLAWQPDAPDIAGGIDGDRARCLGPSAKTAQGIKPPVHRSWAIAGGDHRLTVSDQVEFAQLFDAAATVVRRMPKEEMPQIVAVAAHGRLGTILAAETVDEPQHPVRIGWS